MRERPDSEGSASRNCHNRRSGLPRHHVAPCDKGWTAKRTSRHQKGGRTMTHHGLTRLAALLATGVATSCFMTVPAHAQETVYSFDIPAQDLGGALRSEERRVGKGCVRTCRSRGSQHH